MLLLRKIKVEFKLEKKLKQDIKSYVHMRTTMNYVRLLSLLVVWNLLPNCIIIPLPSANRAAIDKLLPHITKGVTTKEEIISILEKPDVERDRYILYIRKEYDAGSQMVGYCSSTEINKVHMDLYFAFDDYGILTDYNIDKYGDALMPFKEEGASDVDKETSRNK